MTSASLAKRGVIARNNVTISGNSAGRPVIFAHGFGCSKEAWSRVAPAFEADYTVVLFDHVGSGASDLAAYDRSKYDSIHGYVDDVLEIMNELDLRDAVYVGHSVSAMVGVLASVREPDRFGALVLVGPSPRYINDDNYVGGFSEEDITGLLDALDSNYLGWSSRMAPIIVGNSDRPELGEELTGLFCRTNPEVARQFARVTFLTDTRDELSRVTTPTLILQSTDDVIAPLQVGTYVHSEIPNSTFVLLSATGHCANLSGPDEVIEEITAFLA